MSRKFLGPTVPTPDMLHLDFYFIPGAPAVETRVVRCGAHRWIPWAALPVVENVRLADGMPSKNQQWELGIWQLLPSYLCEMHRDRDREVQVCLTASSLSAWGAGRGEGAGGECSSNNQSTTYNPGS